MFGELSTHVRAYRTIVEQELTLAGVELDAQGRHRIQIGCFNIVGVVRFRIQKRRAGIGPVAIVVPREPVDRRVTGKRSGGLRSRGLKHLVGHSGPAVGESEDSAVLVGSVLGHEHSKPAPDDNRKEDQGPTHALGPS